MELKNKLKKTLRNSFPTNLSGAAMREKTARVG